MKKGLPLLCLSLALMRAWNATAEMPSEWRPAGIGGGGAFFQPAISPHSSNSMFVSSDMSGMYHSQDQGQTWETLSFQSIQGGRLSNIEFTSDPSILYALNGSEARTPLKSLDGGKTWSPLGHDPTFGEAFHLFANQNSTNEVLISSWCELHYSRDGGATFKSIYTANCAGDGLHIAGVFFDGGLALIGTNDGLLVSEDHGDTFNLSTIPGIPGERHMISFHGAKSGATIRLYALAAETVWGGITPEDFFWSHQEVHCLNWGDAVWVAQNNGLPTGEGEGLAFIGGPENNTQVAYVSGQNSSESPIIYKTVNGGGSWSSVLNTGSTQNVHTGWAGYQGDRQWSYGGGTVGFCVSPTDGNLAAFTDYGFLHFTNDGGAVWRQAYVNPIDQNPAGAATPQKRAYRGNGLEDTSCWWLTWDSANNLFASYTDIRGARSEDAGKSWSFNYTGHTENTAYQVLKHPSTGIQYMATSSVHDLYESTYLTDSRIDGGSGRILFSTDGGKAWQVLHDFGHPVIWMAFDPSQPGRMLASVVDSQAGGIYSTSNLSVGAASTWVKLANPPRAEGHPLSIHVLPDGALACSYSGRRTNAGFTPSSGVFYSVNNGASWEDRSHLNMRYWTRDLVIDAQDPSGNTWYAGVFSGWGGPPNGLGGLYRTSNRGASWQKIFDSDRVASCAVHPENPNEMYASTETEGLWRTTNLGDVSPKFERVDSYPFLHPQRIFFNPYNAREIWITSFGNGIRVGIEDEPSEVSGWRVY